MTTASPDPRMSLSVACSHIENARNAEKRDPADPFGYRMQELDLALQRIKQAMSAIWAANPDNASANNAIGRRYSPSHNGYVAAPSPSALALGAGLEYLTRHGKRLTQSEAHELFAILGISVQVAEAFDEASYVDVRGLGRVSADPDGFYYVRTGYPAEVS